ncbi:MAG TPA: Na+/H+ antiporter subunit C [Gammaproteobacteria bacterium]|jgi:multicomponent Na+:H+ antiporter subunit C|nr:Na+/H+ antiporter subunit C [Gammaproteobacteria bacterium]
MTPDIIYSGAGMVVFAMGLYGVIASAHILRKLVAINIMGIGVFMLLIATAHHDTLIDPVPHAMVLTGIVVAVAGTALCLWLAVVIRGLEHDAASHPSQ